MINSDAGMKQNLELIASMYEAIASLKRDIAPKNFTNYLIFAEGPVEQIRRLRSEIDEYLGIKEAFAIAEKDALELATIEQQEQESSRSSHEYFSGSSQTPSGESTVPPGVGRS